MKHPEERCWFGAGGFVAELEAQGLAVGSNFAERGDGDFVFGVARRGAVEKKGVERHGDLCLAGSATR
jgi:hypothetical protein